MLDDSTIPILQELDKSKLLIGEGKEEVLFLEALLTHLGINDVKVEQYGGKTKLGDYLNVLLLRPGFSDLKSLGITRDADNDAASAFTSVRNQLVRCGLVAPVGSGAIMAGTPSVGIIIMHESGNAGMLEDLFLATLEGNATMGCINAYFECLRERALPLSNLVSKARVQAWLAAQDPPDLRLGTAAKRGLVDWNHRALEALRTFLTAL